MKLTHSTWLCALLLTALVGCKDAAPAKIAIPDSAEGTVTTVCNELSEGKFQVVWDAMPASYQADVKKLLGEFAEHADKDMWAKGTGIVGKVATVLSTKQDFIIGNAFVKQGLESNSKMKPADVKTVIGEFGGLISDVQGQVKTLDDVKNLKPDVLLAKVGGRIKSLEPIVKEYAQNPELKKGFAGLKETKVKVVKTEGDTSTLEITDANGKVETETLVKVEGKWVPKKMADEWKTNMEKAEKNIHEMKVSEDEKKKFLEMAGQLDEALDKFVSAKTQQEFDGAVFGALGQLGPLMQGFGGGAGPGPGGPGFPAPAGN